MSAVATAVATAAAGAATTCSYFRALNRLMPLAAVGLSGRVGLGRKGLLILRFALKELPAENALRENQ